MPGRDAGAHRFSVRLALVAAAGCVLRLVYDISFRHQVVGSDGNRYHFGAISLADGQGFVNRLQLLVSGVRVPDTGHPPGWTIVLAGVTKLGLRTWLEHQIFTSAVGVGTIVMVGLATRAAFGARTALIAAALAALYPFIWLYEREVLSEPLALLLIATMIWLAYRFRAAPGLGLAVALGAVLGALVMTQSDQIGLAVLLVAPLILWRRDIDLRRRLGWLASAAAVCVTIMAPWSIYLSTRFDQRVVVSGSIGGAMASGNCRQTYDGVLFAYYDVRCARGNLKPGNPIEVDDQLRHRAIDYMRAHEGRTPVVMAARLGRAFGFFRPFQQMHLETERGTSVWVFRVGFFAYWALLPLAVVGAVIARRRAVPVYPLLVLPVLVVVAVLPTIGSVRYRAPAELSLVILAAVALDAALRAWQQRHRESLPPPDSTSLTMKTKLG